jgi:hypothetical protein
MATRAEGTEDSGNRIANRAEAVKLSLRVQWGVSHLKQAWNSSEIVQSFSIAI